nr:hypothetical protein OHB51_24720 [Micromonospora sp. NBC_00855]
MPPELGSDAVGIFEGRTFMLSNPAGDVPADSIAGLVHDDTHYISRWEMTLDGLASLVPSTPHRGSRPPTSPLAVARPAGVRAAVAGGRYPGAGEQPTESHRDDDRADHAVLPVEWPSTEGPFVRA